METVRLSVDLYVCVSVNLAGRRSNERKIKHASFSHLRKSEHLFAKAEQMITVLRAAANASLARPSLFRKMLMKRCYASELQIISSYVQELIASRLRRK